MTLNATESCTEFHALTTRSISEIKFYISHTPMVMFKVSKSAAITDLIVMRVVSVIAELLVALYDAIRPISSCAVAKRPRDASCLSVDSFNSRPYKTSSAVFYC